MDPIILSTAEPAPDAAAQLDALIRQALEAGATGAVIIPADAIRVDPKLADMCREPRCTGYGLSKSCPPHVSGPAGFQHRQARYRRALFFKIDVPADILYSSDRREIFQLLHELAGGIERQAVDMGFVAARAYAGGSCKDIFCRDHADCRVVSGAGECRHPQAARPSMSGFGIDVGALIKTAGWNDRLTTRDTALPETKMAAVYGLVLIG